MSFLFDFLFQKNTDDYSDVDESDEESDNSDVDSTSEFSDDDDDDSDDTDYEDYAEDYAEDYTEDYDTDVEIFSLNKNIQDLDQIDQQNQKLKTYDRPIFENPTISRPTRLSKLGDPFRGDLVILPPNYPVFNPDVNPNTDLQTGIFADEAQNKEKLENINQIMKNYY